MEVAEGLIHKCLIVGTHLVESKLEKAKDPDLLLWSDNSYFYHGPSELEVEVWMTCCGGLDVIVHKFGSCVLHYKSYESFDEPDEVVDLYKPGYWEEVIDGLYQGLKGKGLDYVRYW